MTWDGIPQHRNLRGGGEPVPDLSPESSAARFLDDAAARRAGAEAMRQRYLSDMAARREAFRQNFPGDPAGSRLRDDAVRRRWPVPEAPQRPHAGDPMPPDPFSAGLPGAIAQHEMVESLIEGGWPEHRACYYVACLVSVSLAMQRGGMFDKMPPWPQNPPEEP